MTLFQGALIHVVCPECHSSHSVRAPEPYDVVSYLCPRCLHFWDTSPTLTTTVRFKLELT